MTWYESNLWLVASIFTQILVKVGVVSLWNVLFLYDCVRLESAVGSWNANKYDCKGGYMNSRVEKYKEKCHSVGRRTHRGTRAKQNKV